MSPFLLFGFALTLVILFACFGFLSAKRRREELQALATELDFRYSAPKDRSLPKRFQCLQHLNTGRNRYAENILSGEVNGDRIMVFDYHYETRSIDSEGRSRTTRHHFTVLTLTLPRPFPELMIKPEGLFSKLGQMLGFDDIDFESHEFSRRYAVKSRDKKFAYDFCNAQMIEYLLQQESLIIEVEQAILSLTFERTLSVAAIRTNLHRLTHIRSLIPSYLFS